MGAALGTVGGACDLVMNLSPIKQELKESGGGEGEGGSGSSGTLEHKARERALQKGRELARAEAIKKGAVIM